MARPRKQKSTAVFARADNPFSELVQLVRCLHSETVETRYLEWKSTPPFGAGVTQKIKYRVVKAVLSFANTEGGFVVFGVTPDGTWQGLSKAELDAVDPAMLVELINSSVSPEVVGLNYSGVKRSGRWFAILHVPPSPLAPHVTTKEVVEHVPDRRVLLPKGAVFCRYGAKCDLATSTQYTRIIDRRTALLKAELLRRIREVDVPTLLAKPGSSTGAPTVLRVTAASSSSATPVRVTRNQKEASGIVVYEELDSAIFEEINNVLAAGNLLSPGGDFVFDEKIYHRIYAERQHVSDVGDHVRLARVAILKFYAPMTYWASKLPSKEVAEILQLIPFSSKSPHMRMLCRLAVLLGNEVTTWLSNGLEKTWRNYAQPPDYLFAYRQMLANRQADVRLTALRSSDRSSVAVPGENRTITFRELIANPNEAASFLSRACMEVFKGEANWRSIARVFDIFAYGSDFQPRGIEVRKFLPST